MGDGITKLAKKFKKLENEAPLAYITGTVISVNPIAIDPNGINFPLDLDDLIVPKHLTKRTEAVKINNVESIIEFEGLKAGDKVVFLPSADLQKYLIIGVI